MCVRTLHFWQYLYTDITCLSLSNSHTTRRAVFVYIHYVSSAICIHTLQVYRYLNSDTTCLELCGYIHHMSGAIEIEILHVYTDTTCLELFVYKHRMSIAI